MPSRSRSTYLIFLITITIAIKSNCFKIRPRKIKQNFSCKPSICFLVFSFVRSLVDSNQCARLRVYSLCLTELSTGRFLAYALTLSRMLHTSRYIQRTASIASFLSLIVIIFHCHRQCSHSHFIVLKISVITFQFSVFKLLLLLIQCIPLYSKQQQANFERKQWQN